jgi:hypothetical protein
MESRDLVLGAAPLAPAFAQGLGFRLYLGLKSRDLVLGAAPLAPAFA